jgi:NAD(P)-dependent dehydrogenase (short-subunit alcohol dehydrogenase family)
MVSPEAAVRHWAPRQRRTAFQEPRALRCRSGDRVVVTSRCARGARKAAAQLREEVSVGCSVVGLVCDVSSPASVARLAKAARLRLGVVDLWINNAGYSGSFQVWSCKTRPPPPFDLSVRLYVCTPTRAGSRPVPQGR